MSHRMLVIAAIGIACMGVGARAQNRSEPANHISFVRDGSGRIAFEDWRFAKAIAANVTAGPRWGSVDVVMQQCFGGGFQNDLASYLGATGRKVFVFVYRDVTAVLGEIE